MKAEASGYFWQDDSDYWYEKLNSSETGLSNKTAQSARAAKLKIKRKELPFV